MKSDLALHGPLDSILIWGLGRRQATVGVKGILGKEEDVAKMMTFNKPGSEAQEELRNVKSVH